jgi:hypothetical protein
LSIRNVLSIMAVVALCVPIPQSPAQAQFRDGAFAAGMIGAALGTAIMMQGQRGGRSYQRSRGRTARAQAPQQAREAKNSKDPFAGASAPADYARPVNAGTR